MRHRVISDKTSAQLVGLVSDLCERVDGGQDPTQAVIKLARDHGVQREQIRLICQGYNAGAINAQRQEDGDFNHKFAAVKLADADAAISEVFSHVARPIQQQGKIASVYGELPRAKLKTAADVLGTGIPRAEGWSGKVEEVSREDTPVTPTESYKRAKDELGVLQTARRAADAAESEFLRKMSAAVGTFKHYYGDDHYSLPFLHKWAGDDHGRAGQCVVEHILNKVAPTGLAKDAWEAYRADGTVSTKTASSQTKNVFRPRDPNNPVMVAVKEAIEATADWLQKERQLPALAMETFRKIARIYPRASRVRTHFGLLPPGTDRDKYAEEQWQKRADIFTGAIGGVLSGRRGGGSSGDSEDLVRARLKLNDPKHLNTLRRIQAESMLNRLISADDVVSVADPQSVADAWYELNESAPGIVSNPSLLRANVRRYLQGNLTPYEAKDVVQAGTLVERPGIPTPLPGLSAGRSGGSSDRR